MAAADEAAPGLDLVALLAALAQVCPLLGRQLVQTSLALTGTLNGPPVSTAQVLDDASGLWSPGQPEEAAPEGEEPSRPSLWTTGT